MPSPHRERPRHAAWPHGFTLLEVMVSLAILSISLVAILNLHSGAVRLHNHAKFLTVATLLARSKMVDIEERIYAEDLSEFDETLSGNFAEEGYEGFTWEAELVKPEITLDAGTLEGMVGQLLGLDQDDDGVWGLYRRKKTLIDEDWDRGGETNLLLSNVKSFDVSWWDPDDESWESRWSTRTQDEHDHIPSRIRIRLEVEDPDGEPQTFVTQTRVHLTRPLSW